MSAGDEITLKAAQLYWQDRGWYLGKIDGLWGPMSASAHGRHAHDLLLPETDEPTISTPPKISIKSDWPDDNQSDIVRRFGPPGPSRLVMLDLPYPMRIAWETTTTVNRLSCHSLVKDSLRAILEGILAHYGNIAAVRAARMDLYGGCYNYRKMRGGSSWSRHAWGIAIDIDPDRNGLRTPWPGEATMPLDVIEIFEAAGWKSGARAWSRDAMHFQATK